MGAVPAPGQGSYPKGKIRHVTAHPTLSLMNAMTRPFPPTFAYPNSTSSAVLARTSLI